MPDTIIITPDSADDAAKEQIAIAVDYLGNPVEVESWSPQKILGEKYNRIKEHADFLRAYSDESRLDIIVFLIHSSDGSGKLPSYSVSEIATRFHISLSTVSHHLQELRRVGIVKMERRGKERYYQLDLDYIIERVGHWYHRLLERRDKINNAAGLCADAQPKDNSSN
jgi:DNA-binding transcriptional ArsR family regulator